jgi:hypothetical protein
MPEKTTRTPKEDTIEIVIRGPKKFRQAFINLIYETLTAEEFLEESTKPGCGYTLTSSIEPSDEVMW